MYDNTFCLCISFSCMLVSTRYMCVYVCVFMCMCACLSFVLNTLLTLVSLQKETKKRETLFLSGKESWQTDSPAFLTRQPLTHGLSPDTAG